MLQALQEHPRFGVQDNIIWMKNPYLRNVVCIPHEVFIKGRRLIEIIIDHAHQVVGHFNHTKTSNYIQRSYWWPRMATDIGSFCNSCAKCQVNKTSTQKPQGLLHSLPVLERPWQSIGMDFMGPLPNSNGHDYLLVVIDRLTSQIHLIPTDTRVTTKGIAWLFLKEVVRLHRVPDLIISDRDSKFTTIFWCELQRIMGIRPLMSTAFHPQMDGSTEPANQLIRQILRTVVRNDQKDWANKSPMVEFAMNSNMSSTTGFAPFKLNQGYMPRISIPMSINTQYQGVKQFAIQARANLTAAHDTIIENRMKQMFQANKKCKADIAYKEDDMIYLSTQNLALPKGRARKLVPKFIGPYKIIEAHNRASTVTVKLPPELTR